MIPPRRYANPVRPGFFPDPSAIRVGEDFYLVNSSFQYFPAIPISHSRDLVHWRIVGHVVEDGGSLDLSDLADSHGVWAPDISYSEGWFYVFATLRLNNPGEGPRPAGMPERPLRRQLVARSRRPEGPYSEPWFLDVDDIDPSHFVDLAEGGEGAHYLVISPGVNIVPLSPDCSRIAGGKTLLWPGTGEKAPEGPRLLEKDGWYYAILAEGGTGYGHRVTCARSKSLLGPYEPSPYNPVLRQADPRAPIQRAGHGALVQTAAGRWWMLYLCGRPNRGPYTTLGRETALDPVLWTEDGWFIVNGGKGPSLENEAPELPESPGDEEGRDDFDGTRLAPTWEFVRNPDPAAWSLSERPGHYRIRPGEAGLDSIGAKNTLLRRETSHRYRASCRLEFEPLDPRQEAGLTCYYGIRNHVKLALAAAAEGRRVLRLVEDRNGAKSLLGELEAPPAGPIFLRVVVEAQRRSFSAAFGEAFGEAFGRDPAEGDWILVGTVEDASFLSDEGVLEGKHHTGTLVGLFAAKGDSGSCPPADFDWFEYRAEASPQPKAARKRSQ